MYKVYITWRCDQYEGYFTDDEEFIVNDLGQFLLELPKRVEIIERRNTVISIQISKVD